VLIETPLPVTQPISQTLTTNNPPVTIPQGQDGYVTVYQPHVSPGAIITPVTISTIAPTNGRPRTVIIEIPTPMVSTLLDKNQSTASMVTIPAANGGYITVYRPYPGPGMINAPHIVGTVAPTLGRPGTIIIETPVPQTIAQDTTELAVTTVQGNDGYVTVFQPYTGTSVITVATTATILPSNGQPGTVVVKTPVVQAPASSQPSGTGPVPTPPGPQNPYVTVFQPHTGSNIITAPVTLSIISGVNG
jgi:hypothetical protein